MKYIKTENIQNDEIFYIYKEFHIKINIQANIKK